MFKSFMFVLNSAIPFVLNWYYKRVPMFYLPPGDWFGPMGYLFSFPNAPAGAVSSTVWYVIRKKNNLHSGQLSVDVSWLLSVNTPASFL